MRVAIGGYIAAVNSFVGYRMDLAQFQAQLRLTGDAVLKMGRGETAISGFLDVAEANNWETVPLLFSVPGVWGKVTTEAHEWLKEQFLTALRKAGKVDGVFLQIHGTEAVENVDDGEGDFLAAIRNLIGDKIPLIVSLDGHANVSPLMVKSASMLIGVKTNPHYDFVPIGRTAGRVMAGMFDGSITPNECMGATGDGHRIAETLHCSRLADGAPHACRAANLAVASSASAGRLSTWWVLYVG